MVRVTIDRNGVRRSVTGSVAKDDERTAPPRGVDIGVGAGE